jgi:hypothetical protein
MTAQQRTRLASTISQRIDCRSKSSGNVVAMVEASESWNTDNVSASAVTLGLFASKGSLLVQTEMSPVIVVVTNVLIHQPFQMPLIENDDMIEQITTAIAYEALGHAILPLRCSCCSFPCSLHDNVIANFHENNMSAHPAFPDNQSLTLLPFSGS